LGSSFKGEGYEIKFQGMSVDSIAPVIENKGDKYSLVHITVSSGMKLDRLAPSAVCDEMKKDPDVISCTSDSNTVNFSMRDRCYAVYVADKKKWYFLSKGEESKQIVDKIIPKEVSDKLGY